MEKQTNLTNYENEYSSEISEAKVSLAELKKFGVNDKIISSESYLYEIYGDEIINNINLDEIDQSAQKKIVKLSESEKMVDNEYLNICQSIENSEFDKNVEIIISKVK